MTCTTKQLIKEFEQYIGELRKSSQCGSTWVQDPEKFARAECPNTGEQRLVILGLMLIGVSKSVWMCNKVKESQQECLERFTALVKEVETQFVPFIKGDGTSITELAANLLCFHRCREDPYGLNRRQLLLDPPEYLPDPQLMINEEEEPKKPRKRPLDLDDY